MNLKIRDFDLSVKAGSDGTFTGYASVFGNTDSHKEVVGAGAFADSLASTKRNDRKLPVLWQHRAAEPLGVYERVEEDSKGLFVEGRLLTGDVAKAREAHALMKAGAVSGLSIGYWVRESSFDEKTGIRTLTRVDVEEVSLVTFPANDEARVDAIKFKLAHGQLPTLPEFERFLREAGCSKSQATVIANRGLKHLLSESVDPANATAVTALVERLSGFSLPSL